MLWLALNVWGLTLILEMDYLFDDDVDSGEKF
jgi:hypothetical protein